MLGNGWTYLISGQTKESVDQYTRPGSYPSGRGGNEAAKREMSDAGL